MTDELDLLRWTADLASLERELAAPKPEPLVPGNAPGRPVSPEWRAEMRRRTELVAPTAIAMAHRYASADDAGRRQLVELLAAHPQVMWHWGAVIADAFERYLGPLECGDADDDEQLMIALGLVALFDGRATSRDVQRIVVPARTRMAAAGIDAASVFARAEALALGHDDPDVGAAWLFRVLGPAWDERRSPSKGADAQNRVEPLRLAAPHPDEAARPSGLEPSAQPSRLCPRSQACDNVVARAPSHPGPT